jgi:hypothetical protein
MTKEEALQFFNVDIDDIDDVFEEQLFELKKQLLSIVPIHKIVLPRIKKIEKLNTAYNTLTSNVPVEKYCVIDYFFNENILDTFLKYQEVRGKIRLALMNSTNPENVIAYVQNLVMLELNYASCWKSEINSNEVVVSKQPDPMEILVAIREYSANKGITFDDLKTDKNNPSDLLIQERNRLSLLVTKYSV